MGKVARAKFISLPVSLALMAKRTKKRNKMTVVPGRRTRKTRPKSSETRAKTSSRFLITLTICQTKKPKTKSPKRPTSVIKVKAKELAVTAEALRGKAKELALIAAEKEEVRQKLAVTAEELRVNAEEQAKSEAKSKESEIRYRRLFETAHDGILILNSATSQITDVNPFLEKLLGYSKNEFLNKKLWEVGAFKNMRAAKDAFKILQKEGYSL